MGKQSKRVTIYGLIDPRNQHIRYVGKTAVGVKRRLAGHIALSRAVTVKRHCEAWITGVLSAGLVPETIVLEDVPNESWEEAEVFWIGYFKMLGAKLCNRAAGGPGSRTKQDPTWIAKRVKRGPDNPGYGKPRPPHVIAALHEGARKMRADPIRFAESEVKRKAGITSDSVARSIAGLRIAMADPEKLRVRETKRLAAMQRTEVRAAIGDDSRKRWQEDRQKIIDAQNAGKGIDFRKKQSAAKTHKLTDSDVREIRELRALGTTVRKLADKYGVSYGLISAIALNKRRALVD